MNHLSATELGCEADFVRNMNSASQPEPVADKWFTTSAQPRPMKRATCKQSGSVKKLATHAAMILAAVLPAHTRQAGEAPGGLGGKPTSAPLVNESASE